MEHLANARGALQSQNVGATAPTYLARSTFLFQSTTCATKHALLYRKVLLAESMACSLLRFQGVVGVVGCRDCCLFRRVALYLFLTALSDLPGSMRAIELQ